MVEIDVPITRAFPKRDFLPQTEALLNQLLGVAPNSVALRMSTRGTGDWLGLVEDELTLETGTAQVTWAVHDYSDVGPKDEMELGTHVACVITPVGDRPPMAWALAVAMAIVTAEIGKGTVIDEYLVWTGERANDPASLRKRLTAPKSYSDPENAALDLLEHRAVNGRKVLS
jgi:hypothetical protein